jgi:hypothetical protein
MPGVFRQRTSRAYTSRAPAGDGLVGEPATTADGTPARAAHANAQPDGQFGLRWHEAGGGIRQIGCLGSQLTYAGTGERALVVVVGNDHVIVVGKDINDDTIPTIAAALRRVAFHRHRSRSRSELRATLTRWEIGIRAQMPRPATGSNDASDWLTLEFSF